MNIKPILLIVGLIFGPSMHADNLYKFTGEKLVINQCPILNTGNALDCALSNPGHFVVSQGKKNSERLYTRYGKFLIDSNGFIVNETGEYLLSLTKKSDPNRLSKIKISKLVLPPKATSKLEIEVNLQSNAVVTDTYNFEVRSTIIDVLGNKYTITTQFSRVDSINTWKVKVLAGKVLLDEGTLLFSPTGTLHKQVGLNHIQLPADYGMLEFKIDLKNTTQYGSSFEVHRIIDDGYSLGHLAFLSIDRSGQVSLGYDNGQSKVLKGRIAVAKFTNPNYLEHAIDHLYRPTEKSGKPMIHWRNGEYSVMSGCLEEEPCLTS